MTPDELGMDESIPETNFNENPGEYVPEATHNETIKPIFPSKKIEAPNATENKLAHKRKVQAQRKFKNKQARIARRRNRR